MDTRGIVDKASTMVRGQAKPFTLAKLTREKVKKLREDLGEDFKVEIAGPDYVNVTRIKVTKQ